MPLERSGHPPEEGDLPALGGAVVSEFRIAMGSAERVEAACRRLQAALIEASPADVLTHLEPLAALIRERSGDRAEVLFAFLERVASSIEAPAPLLALLLGAEDPALRRRALVAARGAREAGRAVPLEPLARALAGLLDAEPDLLAEAPARDAFLALLVGSDRDAEPELLRLLRESADAALRAVAAALLDAIGSRPDEPAIENLLGSADARFLAPYLRYTQAGYSEIAALLAGPGLPAPAAAPLREAERALGAERLRVIVAGFGWRALARGIEVLPLVEVAFGDAAPYALSPAEADLVLALPGADRVGRVALVTAHGGGHEEAGEDGGDAVRRFRALNLRHALALGDFLDMAPLDAPRTARILEAMGALVNEYARVFPDEGPSVTAVHDALGESIRAALDRSAGESVLSAELTRLVLAFEDPRTLGEVRTLHGLKRYLHQHGLRLGFRLVGARRGTNRTATVGLLDDRDAFRTGPSIAWVDFDPGTGGGGPAPAAVLALARGFGRQLLAGHAAFPAASIYCYGNEVHYYLSFRAHPAFLRVDYSPPLRGGMIDLEYFGVSKVELEAHPDVSLEGLQALFRALDFDVTVEGTRVRARYDKERALGLDDIQEHAEAMFRAVPYLMDFDWTLGSLGLAPDARRRLAEAWAARFRRWGALPLAHLLTGDRTGLLVERRRTPEGEVEVRWRGDGDVPDRWLPDARHSPWEPLLDRLRALDLEADERAPAPPEGSPGQIELERLLLPFTEALRLGAIEEGGTGPVPASPERFEWIHDARVLAARLDGDDEALREAASLAALVVPIERWIRFRTVGHIDGFEVQRARVAALGPTLRVVVLRDGGGMIALAAATPDPGFHRRRDPGEAPWRGHRHLDPAGFAALLRRSNVLDARPEEAGPADAAALRRAFALGGTAAGAGDDEDVLVGIPAAPGRAVGRVALGVPDHDPRAGEDRVLVTPALTPEDAPALFHATGVITTGGGPLSHAGLLAAQLGKPAVVVAGVWGSGPNGAPFLRYRLPAFEERRHRVGQREIVERIHLREVERVLIDDDLVALDAERGRVTMLGGDREAHALFEAFHRHRAATVEHARAAEDVERLAAVGRRLQARHLLEKALTRLSRPVLVRHAVDEILLGEGIAPGDAGAEAAEFLTQLLAAPRGGSLAREHVARLLGRLDLVREDAVREARDHIPEAESLYEVLALRLAALRAAEAAGAARAAPGSTAAVEPAPPRPSPDLAEIESRALARLAELRRRAADETIRAAFEPEAAPGLRHHLAEIARLDALLDTPRDEADAFAAIRERMLDADGAAVERATRRRILLPGDGGLELLPLLGGKAANLAEIRRATGAALSPPWFVIARPAFEAMLDTEMEPHDPELPPRVILRAAIAAALDNRQRTPAERSARVRRLWEGAPWPPALRAEILDAWRELTGGGPDAHPVAVRSSGVEEDRESAARAGEFDTFLFVRGGEPLLTHVKRAWSGLWTERAIACRESLGLPGGGIGGGVLVQRMVAARVSGVLQTVNVAEGRRREMVLNVGLGLGEGIVSGRVNADHVVVARDAPFPDGPLRFRYETRDKPARIVADERTGQGTALVATLYHQRLRPALEYVELVELVRVAVRLERYYRRPLDIEFAFDGERLWILQARSIPACLAVIRETLARRPLVGPPGRSELPGEDRA